MSNDPDTQRSSKQIYSVQVVRAIAAVLVVLAHISVALYPGQVSKQWFMGASGVDLFFVVSGFIIYVTGRKLTGVEFFKRRAARIIPLYWFFLTLKIVLINVVGYDPTNSANRIGFILGSYMFVPVYRTGMGIRPLISAGWTLNYEMYFYVVVTAVLLLGWRLKLPSILTVWMTAAGVLSFVVTALMPTEMFPPVVLLDPICLEFVSGIWIARWWLDGGRLSPLAALASIATALAMLLSIPYEWSLSFWRFACWGVPAALLVIAAVSLESFVVKKYWYVVLLIGDASYSIYLSHTVILPVFEKIAPRLSANIAFQGSVLFVASTLAGIVAYRFIERPLTRTASKLLRLRVRTPIPQTVEV